jgi:hypothetical protein
MSEDERKELIKKAFEAKKQLEDGIGWLKKSDDDKSHDLLFTSLSRD